MENRGRKEMAGLVGKRTNGGLMGMTLAHLRKL
jgi:hypothetical protein